ncbi:hypothetical protein [Pseudarthrobacter sp. BIM B-2242]|uniref:hypothetical protein n=1 Tax=Pseudarthrobacter sp. BIM B-2242 TaxID=2772401 RepID=UPI00168BEC31|nr:hypothetical protein [Pseudarthrobacter sp. BIM B-2242]QOD06016.1 hypothetical protein IDT60_20850 [Pseudarthrobacter sp. BIM B-2242]
MRTVAHSTSSLVVAAHQMLRLEILADTYAGQPEESALILRRLETACLQAGHPEQARAVHQRTIAYAAQCGNTAAARWEASPRWFRRLAGRFRPSIELLWENGQYRRMAAIINQHLADVERRTHRLKAAA